MPNFLHVHSVIYAVPVCKMWHDVLIMSHADVCVHSVIYAIPVCKMWHDVLIMSYADVCVHSVIHRISSHISRIFEVRKRA